MAKRGRGQNGPVEIRRLSLLLIVLCLLQYLLGMELNLFVSISRHHPGASGSDFLVRAFQSVIWGISHGGYLALHAGLGIVLVLGSIGFALAAFAVSQPRIRTAAVVGAVAVLAAAFNGAAFLNYGANANSMYMAVFLAIALFCFAWALFRATATSPEPPPSAG
ncbi:MAG: hypothetical protein WA751_09445 [Candidatus Dormiibacterota bacterium]